MKLGEIIAVIVGLAIGGWLFVAAPMLHNVQVNGCPFIVCSHSTPDSTND